MYFIQRTPTTVTRSSRHVVLLTGALWLAASHAASAQAIGYVWNSNPAASGTYRPNATYAFDSKAAHGTTITHNSTGSYTVHFAKLGNSLGSNVQVGAYGSSSTICASAGWLSSDGVTVDVGVSCHDLSNTPVDAYFTAMYQERTSWSGKGTLGFLWASNPSDTSSYNPNSNYSFNSKSGTNTIFREGAGNYTVEMEGIAGKPNGNLNPYVGSALVSTYDGNAICRSIVLGHNGTAEAITINCWDIVAQSPVDSYFTLAYSYNVPIDAGNKAITGAYVRGTKPKATFTYAPQANYQFNGFGTGALTVHRNSTGIYSVTIPGTPSYTTSMAMANLEESEDYVPQNGSFCNVVNWSISSSTITVGCYGPAGAPEDAIFGLTYLTSAKP